MLSGVQASAGSEVLKVKGYTGQSLIVHGLILVSALVRYDPRDVVIEPPTFKVSSKGIPGSVAASADAIARTFRPEEPELG